MPDKSKSRSGDPKQKKLTLEEIVLAWLRAIRHGDSKPRHRDPQLITR